MVRKRKTASLGELPESRSTKRKKVESRCETRNKTQPQSKSGTPKRQKVITPSRKRKLKSESNSEQNGHLSESEDNKVEVNVKKKQRKSKDATLKPIAAKRSNKEKANETKKPKVRKTPVKSDEISHDNKKRCSQRIAPNESASLSKVKTENLERNTTIKGTASSKKTRTSRTPKKSSIELTDKRANLDDQYKATSTVNEQVKKEKTDDPDSSGDESEDDTNWEDVQEAEGHHDEGDSNNSSSTACGSTYNVQNKGVEISLPIPGMKSKRKKKNEDDLLTKIKKAMERFKKQIQLDMHKAYFLSFVPSHLISKSVKKWQSDELTNFITWFKEDFPSLQQLRDDLSKSDIIPATSYPRNMAEVLVILLRSLGILTRLVSSLQPVSMKISKDSKKSGKKSIASKKLQNSSKSNVGEEAELSAPQEKTNKICKSENILEDSDDAESKPTSIDTSNTNSPASNTSTSMQPSSSLSSSSSQSKAANVKETSKENNTPTKLTPSRIKKKKNRTEQKEIENGPKTKKLRKQKKVNYVVDDNSDNDDKDEESCYSQEKSNSESDVEFEKEKIYKAPVRKPLPKAKKCKTSPTSESKKSTSVVEMIDDDDLFEITSKPRINRRNSTQHSQKNSSPVQMVSDDSDEGATTLKSKIDVWAEIFLPTCKSWWCVDLVSYSINQPELCEKYASKPLVYVVAYNNENSVKDVTGRYASDWLSKTKKLRVDADWWEDTLLPYKTRKKKMDEMEDSQLLAQHQERPLPQSITEYKNHPLYVLKRHLLKFEAIYPETATTLGFIRGEAVYSKDCVHLLHTREKWMSLEGRVVKQGQEPYKIVKGRMKRNQQGVDPSTITIDLFGHWQTEEYKPPPVKDGKVPRNEYGNVELFKPSMLPPGSKHIQIPGIQKIAKKLGIDGAPAVVGFDFHCGFCHPVIDGLVVAKESVATLMDAWRQEQDVAEKRKEDKREKKVLGYWKLFVKSLLIRERLKRKYDSQESRTSSEQSGEKLEDEKIASITVSWPENMKQGNTSSKDDGHCHVFPKELHKKDTISGEWTKSCSCGYTLPLC